MSTLGFARILVCLSVIQHILTFPLEGHRLELGARAVLVRCPKCQIENSETGQFCGGCGLDFEALVGD